MKKAVIISAAVIVIAALVCVLMLCFSSSDTVIIKSGGKVIKTIELSKTDDCTINVENDGGINTVVIKDHKIYVSEANCPDRICVKTGELKYSFAPIICIPNKLEIYFAGSSDITIDAASR